MRVWVTSFSLSVDSLDEIGGVTPMGLEITSQALAANRSSKPSSHWVGRHELPGVVDGSRGGCRW